MSFFAMLETLLIGPIKLVFEILFQYFLRLVNRPGLAIIVLSLIMNILVLPLYRRADAMQEQARDVENKLREGTAHIKKTFSGDERMMILQTYNRQNNYKPTDVFKGSISLLLEIPFFMAAYQFLSHLQSLNGISFGPISDLSKPDGLLTVFGITLNMLPILMTLINVISAAIYLKGFPLKTKIQLYGMALFFLVFLYTSPAGLVFYWTLNNVFSLIKNIFYKIKNPQEVLKVLTFVVGIVFLVISFYHEYARKSLIVLGLILMIPLLTSVYKKIFKPTAREFNVEPKRSRFVLGALFLTLFIGVFIPSVYVAASPQEYVDVTYFHNPLWYIANCAILAAGSFLVWLGVFYWLANKKWKVIFERLIWVACGAVVVNYMFFGTDLGIISSDLRYVNGMFFSVGEKLINIAVLAVVGLGMFLAVIKFRKITSMVLVTAIIAVSVMSGMNIVTSSDLIDDVKQQNMTEMPHFDLSVNGKNVVVIMLDRAISLYVPYIFNEKPELKEAFEGFTFYSNTISFGAHTNFGAPALMGGYEYTPVELNKRSEEKLVDKHNEALKVMPVLFSQNGYNVTVCDPPYGNYSWATDLSIYDEYPEIKPYVTKGVFADKEIKMRTIETTMRNFFCFGIMKSMPLFLQNAIYNEGAYNHAVEPDYATTQTYLSLSTATGIGGEFMKAYNVLDSLDVMTSITSDGENNFLLLVNDTTHEPALLDATDYSPSANVDNTKYDAENADRFTHNGKTLVFDEINEITHYHINVAAYIQLAEWFDYLRENDVYDNTRIIIVSDHAIGFSQSEELIIDGVDLSAHCPVLMVKDFNSEGEITISEEFMTNADVPTLAVEGCIKDPVNPFTNQPINNKEKSAHDQYITLSFDWDVLTNYGNTFNPSKWASVKGDIFDKQNWKISEKDEVLNKHEFSK